MKEKIKKIKNVIIRLLLKRINTKKIDWLSRKSPFSRSFGLDRGDAIDRKLIENFLALNSDQITGDILEVGDDRYTLRYGINTNKSVVFTGKPKNKKAITHHGDLTNLSSFRELGTFSCVIATNVINFIYDFDKAVFGLSKLTDQKKGICLVTVAGICPISRFDYDRYGDYWRFNDLSIKKIFKKYFHEVEVTPYGNAPLAAAFIMGLSQQEIPESLYEFNDKDFQIIVTVKAKNPKN